MVLAWSTPGAAVIAATSGITFAEAVGAFVVTGTLLALTGAVRPLGQLVARIPEGIAGGMLAGVLLPFCLQGAGAAQRLPMIVLPMVAAFALVRLWNPAIAVLAALALGLVLAFGLGTAPAPDLASLAAKFRAILWLIEVNGSLLDQSDLARLRRFGRELSLLARE